MSAAPSAAHEDAAATSPSDATSNSAQSNNADSAPSIPSPPPQRNESTPRNRRPSDEIRLRAQERQQRLENQMRQAMSNLGCSDIPTQDAIISYLGADIRARRPLQAQSRRLFNALRSADLPEDKLASMVADFRAAVEADKQRRAASEAALDGRIKYSQNPRLEAMLLLFGVIGDSPLLSVMREASNATSPANRNMTPDEKNPVPARKPSAYDNPMQNGATQNNTAPDVDAPSTTPSTTPENTEQAVVNAQPENEAQDNKKEKRRRNREERDNKKENSGDKSSE
ncbi:MAG TPA: hypothetical protein VF600_14260 [Abditibacteriaceae bacterium]